MTKKERAKLIHIKKYEFVLTQVITIIVYIIILLLLISPQVNYWIFLPIAFVIFVGLDEIANAILKYINERRCKASEIPLDEDKNNS